MAEKIKVLNGEYEKFCTDAEEMKYKCRSWPEITDIRDKILPNLEAMLPFIAWVLYTAPEPTNRREEDVKHFLHSITKDYYEYVEDEKDLDDVPIGTKQIEMPFDTYITLCDEAESMGPDPDGWPSLEQVKKEGIRSLKKNLKRYIRLAEVTPCTTKEEKDCCQYLNRLIQANVRFTDEGGEA